MRELLLFLIVINMSMDMKKSDARENNNGCTWQVDRLTYGRGASTCQVHAPLLAAKIMFQFISVDKNHMCPHAVLCQSMHGCLGGCRQPPPRLVERAVSTHDPTEAPTSFGCFALAIALPHHNASSACIIITINKHQQRHECNATLL